jgi:hypothetical protein
LFKRRFPVGSHAVPAAHAPRIEDNPRSIKQPGVRRLLFVRLVRLFAANHFCNGWWYFQKFLFDVAGIRG